MLPNYRICDCCGKRIDISTGYNGRKVPIESFGMPDLPAIGDPHWSSDMPGRNEVHGSVEITAVRGMPELDVSSAEGFAMNDICDGCKLKMLERAVSWLKAHGNFKGDN